MKESVFTSLGFYRLNADSSGRIRGISTGLSDRLGFSMEDLKRGGLPMLFPDATLTDLTTADSFHMYRTTMKPATGPSFTAQISGRKTGDIFEYVIEELQTRGFRVETGPIEETAASASLLKRYVSRQLRDRAKSSAKAGFDQIQNEVRTLTFLFADLVSYTSHAEKNTPDEIVEMLNLSIGATSSTVLHWNGHIDKIMGDSIFAVFENPLNAIVTAIEIQKQFNFLNMFRIKNDQDEILLRIGINTGVCIQASIGSPEFMEMTYIGDAVNIASRLEKSAVPGSILVSRATLDPVKDQVFYSRTTELVVKGKELKIEACYVNKVTFLAPNGREVTLDKDEF